RLGSLRGAGEPGARGRHRGAERRGVRAARGREARGAWARPGRGRRVSVAETTQLIEPHGGKLVDRTGARPDGVEKLEQLELTPRELSDLDMLASGALSPLEGFMARHDYESVVDNMRLANGLPWALPVC